MPKEIEIVIPHRLGADGARRRVQDASAALKAEFGSYVSSWSEQWSGNHLAFEVKALGATAVGVVDVSPERLDVKVSLPLLLRPFAGQIEQYAGKHGPKFFS